MITNTVSCTYRNTFVPASRLRAVVDLLTRARSESLGHDWHFRTQEYTVEYPPLVVNCARLDELIQTIDSKGDSTRHRTRLTTRSGRLLQFDATDPLHVVLTVNNRRRTRELVERVENVLGLQSLPRGVFLAHAGGRLAAAVREHIEGRLPLKVSAADWSDPQYGAQQLAIHGESCSYAIVLAERHAAADSMRSMLHALGFFQGRYGERRVCLLHESGLPLPGEIGRSHCCELDESGFDTAARVRLQRLLAEAFADLLLKSAIPPSGE